MPDKITNNQDIENFLKDGYASRAQAIRDGAGNIKLFENTTDTTNTTIMVEPVTSQFSTETALKLFETRFEYFKFPVQTVSAASLIDIDKNINAEVANTLAGVSFEQDIITRRMELVPLVAGSDKIEWLAPTPWYWINFKNADVEEVPKGSVPYGTANDVKPDIKFLSEYQRIMEDTRRATVKDRDAGITLNGLQSISLNNSNSPRGKGWFRITPDMLRQIKAGGQLQVKAGDNRAPWKRNIKLKFSCNWSPDDPTQKAFNQHGFITGAIPTNGESPHVNLSNGVCLIVELVNSKWQGSWRLDTSANEPQAPIFIQSTSAKIGPQLALRDDGPYFNVKGRFNPIVSANQYMNIEYVIDSRDLFWDQNTDVDVEEPTGQYQEYSWNVMATHPVILNACNFEISVEELPDRLAIDSGYGYYSNQPKTDYNPYIEGGQLKSNQFRSLFCKYTYNETGWIGGVRKVNGKNILGIQNGNDKLVVGYTDNNEKWESLHRWDDWAGSGKWIRSTPYMVANANLFDIWHGKNYISYSESDGRHKFNQTIGRDVTAFFRTLDTIVKNVPEGATPIGPPPPPKAPTITDLYKRTHDFVYKDTKYSQTTGLGGAKQLIIPFAYKGGNGAGFNGGYIPTNDPNIFLWYDDGDLKVGDGVINTYLVGTPKESLKFTMTLFGFSKEIGITVYIP